MLMIDWDDAGVYMCKTNSGTRSEQFSLSVSETVAVITGGPRERHLVEGDSLMLHCLVKLAQGPNTYFRQSAVLHWFHNQRLIDPDAGREVGGVR